ncbi:hypothetical protein SMD11_1586 [Streptomyces albireticuli]|uniref:Uncharacterized protein n=1 Tax=Streptomyces albireticuli TaxID=1940 RepID=A0A1Z2KYW1_9ACTN|nr:hypothetical protein [Streptomyces albireticuli]ARZ67247.1 hypothetical protein SMD11_1586 [Streptomyces albireticuli]
MDVTLSAASNVVAVLALVVAWVQLTRLRDERRRNFYLTQLVAIADALDEHGGSAPHRVDVRVRTLPQGMAPVAWAWVTEGDRPPSSLYARFETVAAPGEDWGTWVRACVREEINQAVASQLTASGNLRRFGRR